MFGRESNMTPASRIAPIMQDMDANIRRRVINMSPDQVEKKRAIDRENQRHCRAKTKVYIKSLEKKVAELTCQLHETQTELDLYRRRDKTSESSSGKADHNVPIAPESEALLVGNDVTTLSEKSATLLTCFDGSASDPYTEFKTSDFFRLPLDFSTGTTLNSSDEFTPSFDFWEFPVVDLGYLDSSLVSPYRDETHAPSVNEQEKPITTWFEPQGAGNESIWQQVPLQIAATYRIEQVIIETTAVWRSRAHARREDELGEPTFPSISSLLNPSSAGDEDSHTDLGNDNEAQTQRLSDVVAAQVGRTIIRTLPERIAFAYNLSHLIRWLACRTKESYEAMPEFLRPTELQRTVPHPAWIDMIVWPEARDHMILHMDWSRFLEFRRTISRCMSVNWLSPISEAVVESSDKQCLVLHPIFEAHLRNLENWSLTKPVDNAFEFLKPYYR